LKNKFKVGLTMGEMSPDKAYSSRDDEKRLAAIRKTQEEMRLPKGFDSRK